MKYENDHLRAQTFIAASLGDSLNESDSRWLYSHLAECPTCQSVATGQREAIRVLKTVPLRTPPFLAARTKARVHSRGREMDEARRRVQLLIISCVLAFVFTVALIPLVWQVLVWAGWMNVADKSVAWYVGIAWFWLAPALAGAAIIFSNRKEQQSLFRSALMRRLGNE